MATSALPLLAQGWFIQSITSELALWCAAVIVTCLFAIALLIRAMVRMGAAARNKRRAPAGSPNSPASRPSLAGLLSDTRGTTSIEFALVFPILLTLSLLLTQAMMMMAGIMYVNYAAFQAARHATIEIPQDYTQYGGLEANHYTPGRTDLKHERIRRAAYMALLPVAGQIEGGIGGPSSETVAGIRNHFAAYGAPEPKWIDAMLAGKVSYAEEHTEIELLETVVHEDHDVTFESLPETPYRYGVRDVITVQVIHKLNLGVPFVSRFFSDGDNGAKGPGRYSLITARATLPNEGVPLALPDLPDIDRVTPNLPGTSNNPNDPGTVNVPNVPNVPNIPNLPGGILPNPGGNNRP